MCNKLIKWSIIALLPLVYMLIPIHYHIPTGDVNSETNAMLLAWFLEHVADSNDTVELEIASYGGDVVYGLRVASAIKNSDAHTIGTVKSAAFSMGSIYLLSCDEQRFASNSLVMIHKARAGSKVIDLPLVDNLISEIAFPYMTQLEILNYSLGNNVFIEGKVLEARINIVKNK